jgi:quercetin dioxygenase-like cupin family protein
MSRTGTIAGATVAGVLAICAGTAFALSNISLTSGSLPGYDFGSINLTTGDIDQVGTKPATVQFQTFAVKPGEAIGWHYHRGLAYVVIEHGTLSEQHLNGNGTCAAWETFRAGSAFVEQPGEVHRVANTGKGEAVVTWAPAFPAEDGVV